jgi:hypothetical protein
MIYKNIDQAMNEHCLDEIVSALKENDSVSDPTLSDNIITSTASLIKNDIPMTDKAKFLSHSLDCLCSYGDIMDSPGFALGAIYSAMQIVSQVLDPTNTEDDSCQNS